MLTPELERELGGKVQAAYRADEAFRRGECGLSEKEAAEREAAEARDQLIRSNLRLVVNIAKGYAKRGLPLADLIEEGNLGLLRAVEGYDPSHDTRFSTYASWWIKQAIKRSLINSRQPVHIPAYMVEMITKWKQAARQLEEKLGRQPTLAEMADHMQLPERRIQIVKRAVKAFAAPTQSSGPEGAFPLAEMLPDPHTPLPEEAVFDEADTEVVRQLLNHIDDREATILRLRYGIDEPEPLTLKQIGAKIGLTRERVRQIEHGALRKLNELLNEEKLPC